MFKEDVKADDKKDEHVFVYTDGPGDEEDQVRANGLEGTHGAKVGWREP